MHTIADVMKGAKLSRTTVEKLINNKTLEGVKFFGDRRVYITDESYRRLFIPIPALIPAKPRPPGAPPQTKLLAAATPKRAQRRGARAERPAAQSP
jgi:hypothetical protein